MTNATTFASWLMVIIKELYTRSTISFLEMISILNMDIFRLFLEELEDVPEFLLIDTPGGKRSYRTCCNGQKHIMRRNTKNAISLCRR